MFSQETLQMTLLKDSRNLRLKVEQRLCFRLMIVLLSMQLLQARGQEWDIKVHSLYPSLPIAAPWSDNEECRNDSRLLIQALNNFSLWAVQMLDASSRQSDGILYGNLYQMGNYDECMEITKPILAQYCLVKVSVKISTNSSFNFDPFVQNHDPHLSFWDRMSVKTPSRMPRNSIYQALCVPASCSHQDLETAVNQYLKKHKNPIGIQYTAEVAPNLCSVIKEEPFTLGEQIFMSVTAFILLLVATGTILDYAYGGIPQSGMLILDLLLCFSMRKNLKSLKPPHESTKLDVLNSFKFICICFIISCHRAGYYGASPLWNLEFIEREFELPRLAFIYRADLIVDNFFVIGGLLMSYMLLKELPKGRVKAIQLILLRMLRLIPAVSMMVFFYATVFYRLDSGPRWDAVIGPEREYCQKNWWTNLLFINNYVDVEHLCLMQSYYTACDMHFFIIAIPVVMLLWRRPLLGVLTLIVLTVLSILVPFLITYLNQMPAIIVMSVDVLLSPRTNDVFSSVYIKSHARASPYLIGLATGYLMHKFENNKSKLGMKESIILCLGIVNMLGAILMYGALFYDVSRPYSAIEAGLFAALQRFFWALGTSAFIIIITFGTVPMVSSILSNKLLIRLGHLVYGLVLVHPVILYYDLGSLRRPEYVQYHFVFMSAIGDIVISLIMALALFLTVEEPFRQMTKLILSRRSVGMVNEKSE